MAEHIRTCVSMYMSVCMSTCLSTCVSTLIPTLISACMNIGKFTYVSIHMCKCMPTYVSGCMLTQRRCWCRAGSRCWCRARSKCSEGLQCGLRLSCGDPPSRADRLIAVSRQRCLPKSKRGSHPCASIVYCPRVRKVNAVDQHSFVHN